MNENNNKQLDVALEKLLAGEDLSAVEAQFPDLVDELRAHHEVMRAVSQFSLEVPQEDSLRRVIASVRGREASARPHSTISFLNIFVTYRTVMVPLVLVLVLVAGGYVIVPSRQGTTDLSGGTPEGAGLTRVGDPLGDTAQPTEDAALFATSEAIEGPAAKSMSIAQAPAPQATVVPQDQELAAVYGDEMVADEQSANADSVQADSAADDSGSIAQYASAYDANEI